MKVLRTIFILLSIAAPALAQVGTFSGRVLTPEGNPVTGIEIRATSETGAIYSVRTDRDGKFLVALKVGVYKVQFSGAALPATEIFSFQVSTSDTPIDFIVHKDGLQFNLEPCGPGGYCGFEADATPIKIEPGSVSSLLTSPSPNNRKVKTDYYKLSGRVTDSEGAAISKVKVTAISILEDSRETVTDEEGSYELVLPRGEYSLTLDGVPGFRKTIVQGLQIKDRPLSLDIALDVDHESPTSTYTEFVCDSNGMCKTVSRRGDGSTKPK